MGLLSKAALETVHVETSIELDAMGKVLTDRIAALPRSESSPETAISLLKAYGSFRAGVCLARSGDTYRSYASVGTAGENIAVPAGALFPVPEKGCFSLKDIPPFPAGTKLWAFSLDEPDSKNPAHILLTAEDNNYIFQPGQIRLITSLVRGALLPYDPAAEAPPPPAVELEPAPGGLFQRLSQAASGMAASGVPILSGNALIARLGACFSRFSEFRGFIYETQEQSFLEAVSEFAFVTAIKTNRFLVLFRRTLDYELLLHHLSGSIPGKNLFSFEAKDSGEALAQIKPYL